jgi:hypothetical protein
MRSPWLEGPIPVGAGVTSPPGVSPELVMELEFVFVGEWFGGLEGGLDAPVRIHSGLRCKLGELVAAI